jgi:hypothetical protein
LPPLPGLPPISIKASIASCSACWVGIVERTGGGRGFGVDGTCVGGEETEGRLKLWLFRDEPLTAGLESGNDQDTVPAPERRFEGGDRMSMGALEAGGDAAMRGCKAAANCSTSLMLRCSQPCWTLTMAYASRVLS